MFSSLQRLNHITSLATTYVMILLGLISVASYLALPPVPLGKLDVKDLIMWVVIGPPRPELTVESEGGCDTGARVKKSSARCASTSARTCSPC